MEQSKRRQLARVQQHGTRTEYVYVGARHDVIVHSASAEELTSAGGVHKLWSF